jgi:hypothetical protein
MTVISHSVLFRAKKSTLATQENPRIIQWFLFWSKMQKIPHILMEKKPHATIFRQWVPIGL